MIVGTSGFSWSGSTAVTELLMEFEETQVLNNFEFILAYFPDGLEDLDFHLNTNCSKFLSSTVAIPRFRWVANHLLYEITRGEIKQLTEQYLSALTQVKWKGLGQGQILIHNKWLFKNFGQNFTYKLLRRFSPRLSKKINLYPLNDMEFSIKPENFLEETLKYTDSILKSIGLDLNRMIVLDQPFAGNDPAKSLKYYRDSRAIIVDRDPRELYLLAKEFFPKRSYQVPHENVDDFILYYMNMHKTLKDTLSNEHVLYVKFEDLVYDYEYTVNRIKNFLGIVKHTRPRAFFVPEKSMVNTRLFEKCTKFDSDIKEIENKLPMYIYNFDKHKDKFTTEESNQNIFDYNEMTKNYSRN